MEAAGFYAEASRVREADKRNHRIWLDTFLVRPNAGCTHMQSGIDLTWSIASILTSTWQKLTKLATWPLLPV